MSRRNARNSRRGASASSGYSPPPLAGQLVAWFDPAAGLSVSSGNVDSWTDRVAGAAVSNTGSNRPTAGTINGRSAVLYASASSQSLANASTAIAAAINNTGYTAYFVARPTLTAQRYLMSVHDGAGVNPTRSGHGLTAANNTQATRHNGTVEVVSSGATVVATANSPHVITYQHTGAGGTFNTRIDGAADLTASANAQVLATQVVYCLGAIYVSAASRVLFFNGEMGDHLLYSAIHTAPEMASVEAWLRAKYAF